MFRAQTETGDDDDAETEAPESTTTEDCIELGDEDIGPSLADVMAAAASDIPAEPTLAKPETLSIA